MQFLLFMQLLNIFLRSKFLCSFRDSMLTLTEHNDKQVVSLPISLVPDLRSIRSVWNSVLPLIASLHQSILVFGMNWCSQRKFFIFIIVFNNTCRIIAPKTASQLSSFNRNCMWIDVCVLISLLFNATWQLLASAND